MQENQQEAAVQEYVEAFNQRDLSRCLAFFDEDARIQFAMGNYRGIGEVEEWHKARFEADLKVLSVDRTRSNGDTVTIDATATSRIAVAWKLPTISGRVVFTFHQGKIIQAKFGLQNPIALEGWA